MDIIYVYTVAIAAVLGVGAGFVIAGIVASGGEAEAAAEADRLRWKLKEAERQRSAAMAKSVFCQSQAEELKRRLDEKSAEVLKTCDSVIADGKELCRLSRTVDDLRKQLHDERQKNKQLRFLAKKLKKNFRYRRKAFQKRARGKGRLFKRPFPRRGSGARRSKQHLIYADFPIGGTDE
ncbi:MAG: hypothetical protein IJ822_04310 [Pyramidobacter sp.]|nr:hypothetical protein [Pyramidobacter sp.]MBQ8129437.1 hypothetical protein [Clostridia bacterium]MBR1895983.1 hypothetical protein [Pyramidobacter sp.]